MRICLICLLLALCLLGSAVADEISLPPAGIGTHTMNFAAVHDEESGAMYFALPSWGNAAFWRYHPEEGWRKIAQIWNDVWDVKYSGGWLFYRRSGGWSGGYIDLHAVNVKTGKKVYLLKNRCGLTTAHNGEAIVWDSLAEQQVRLNPETMERTEIDWLSGWRTMKGAAWQEEGGQWYFQPYGGETVPLDYTADVQTVYALSQDCWISLTGALDFRLTIYRGGEAVLNARYHDCLVDDRYVVWYMTEQEKTTHQVGGMQITTAADKHIKHLRIYDTQTGADPLQLSIPVNMRIDSGMYLADGKVWLLTESGRHATITCIDLATGETSTLQN